MSRGLARKIPEADCGISCLMLLLVEGPFLLKFLTEFVAKNPHSLKHSIEKIELKPSRYPL